MNVEDVSTSIPFMNLHARDKLWSVTNHFRLAVNHRHWGLSSCWIWFSSALRRSDQLWDDFLGRPMDFRYPDMLSQFTGQSGVFAWSPWWFCHHSFGLSSGYLLLATKNVSETWKCKVSLFSGWWDFPGKKHGKRWVTRHAAQHVCII